MDEFINNLKRQASENPMVALGVGAAFATAMSKLLDANTARTSAKTYAKEVDRRIKKNQK